MKKIHFRFRFIFTLFFMFNGLDFSYSPLHGMQLIKNFFNTFFRTFHEKQQKPEQTNQNSSSHRTKKRKRELALLDSNGKQELKKTKVHGKHELKEASTCRENKLCTSLPALTSIAMQPHQIPSFYQDDGWRCGYFATFNLLNMIKIIDSQGQEALEQLDLNSKEYKQKFDLWEKTLSTHHKFAEKFEAQEYIGINRVEALLQWGLEKLESTVWLNNIAIFDAQIMNLEILPLHNPDLIANIEQLRTSQVPQGLLIVNDRHWTAFILFPDGSLYGTDSLDQKHCRLYKQSYVKEIFNLFTNYPMPSEKDLKTLLKGMRKGTIKTLSLEGYTEKQQTYLHEHLQKSHKKIKIKRKKAQQSSSSKSSKIELIDIE